MRNFLTLILILSGTMLAVAQQTPQYTMYMFNKMAFNPAYAGLDNSLSITGAFRRQWDGFEDAPTTQNVNVHMPFYFLSSGVGLSLENDALGVSRNTTAKFSYNYQLPIGRTGILAMGMSAGVVQQQLDGSELRTPDGIYEGITIDHQDVLLPNANVSEIAPTFDAGVYFMSERLEIGFSVLNLTEQSIEFETFNITPVRTYFFNAGSHFDIGRSLTFHPSVLIKSDVVQTQADFSAIVSYDDNIFLGASFRGYNANTQDAVAIIGGWKLSENLTVGYSYDITLSGLRDTSSGTHEVMVNYNLNKVIGAGKPPRIIYNPRFL